MIKLITIEQLKIIISLMIFDCLNSASISYLLSVIVNVNVNIVRNYFFKSITWFPIANATPHTIINVPVFYRRMLIAFYCRFCLSPPFINYCFSNIFIPYFFPNIKASYSTFSFYFRIYLFGSKVCSSEKC